MRGTDSLKKKKKKKFTVLLRGASTLLSLPRVVTLKVPQLQTNNISCTIETILQYKGKWMYIFRLQIFFTDVVSII